jgi:hypothetical protein
LEPRGASVHASWGAAGSFEAEVLIDDPVVSLKPLRVTKLNDRDVSYGSKPAITRPFCRSGKLV